MEQIVIITDKQNVINNLLNKEWHIVSVTAQHLSTGGNSHLYGNFCFVLERKVK